MVIKAHAKRIRNYPIGLYSVLGSFWQSFGAIAIEHTQVDEINVSAIENNDLAPV